ncbi:MAG TPA: DUF1653 domain-containing protein [Opitutales bacterium]|jgi:hypothetical protein|nr:DUF1653 domain-containing protein [Opitutales bacterium]
MKKSPPIPAPPSLPCGVYRHYKGNNYLVLGVAQHSETGEICVVYARMYPRPGLALWMRPLENFCGMTKNAHGKKVKRFKFVGAGE